MAASSMFVTTKAVEAGAELATIPIGTLSKSWNAAKAAQGTDQVVKIPALYKAGEVTGTLVETLGGNVKLACSSDTLAQAAGVLKTALLGDTPVASGTKIFETLCAVIGVSINLSTTPNQTPGNACLQILQVIIGKYGSLEENLAVTISNLATQKPVPSATTWATTLGGALTGSSMKSGTYNKVVVNGRKLTASEEYCLQGTATVSACIAVGATGSTNPAGILLLPFVLASPCIDHCSHFIPIYYLLPLLPHIKITAFASPCRLPKSMSSQNVQKWCQDDTLQFGCYLQSLTQHYPRMGSERFFWWYCSYYQYYKPRHLHQLGCAQWCCQYRSERCQWSSYLHGLYRGKYESSRD